MSLKSNISFLFSFTKMTIISRALFLGLVTCFTTILSANDWIHLSPPEGRSKGKKIVFVTGDDEYKSETSMPMMAHVLSEHHGFDCRVLFAINRKTGLIDTNQRDNIPGLEALADADLMVIFTRFRALEDAQMKMIEGYLASGKPIVAIRTSTHAFNFSSNLKSPYAKYSYNNNDTKFKGGFGEQILGQDWIRHWGRHGTQSTRGRFAAGEGTHPILTGIKDGEIWGPTDVYEATLPMVEGCQPILLGEVCETMNPDSGPAPAPSANAKGRSAIDKNNPMMPIAWTYQRPVGAKGRVFTSTIGGAMSGKDDWANAGMRRMFVNACFWTLGMENQIPKKANVTPVLQPNPFRRGVNPAETLATALAEKEGEANTILFYGNSMIERLLEHGELEARLQIANPKAGLKIRSLAWTGDEVGNRLRLEGYAQHMKNLIAEWPAGTLVLGYGFYESFAGAKGLTDFEDQYRVHLKQLRNVHPGAKIITLSPIASEDASAERNADLELYSESIKKLAAETNAKYIDIFTPTRDAYATSDSKLTDLGIHLNKEGNGLVAKVIAEFLTGSLKVDPTHLKEVTLAASAKHERVAEVVRPKNAVVYFGVRARPEEYADEMPRYHKMIDLTEAVVHQLAARPDQKFSTIEKPSLAPMPKGKGRDDGNKTGIIKTVAKNQAEMKVADDYEFNLFASEEEFPELRNPVQISFDARGRLWVVTMPSFPHTVPGLTPLDKILILEDLDKDGKADKCTTYMEGLDALDGVAFHRDGVIISEQPRLWMTRDTNGDGKADYKKEMLRGIDVTDSHHGGMIKEDPSGDIIFSDGVFHRSQLETPFGVHRGIDATTYRLNVASGKINTEYQHTTPNPWNVDFDRYGDTFQMYGDGIFYDSIVLPWTPLGAYHPFRYGSIGQFGKGSGIAIVSSPNYPDKFQEGMASASLLGKYAVTLTQFDYTEGMITRGDAQVILSSPNAAFRPADLEYGMDGALYVSDFCSPIIGHAQHPMRDPHWDHDYGRIWRIVHKKKPLVTDIPNIEGETPENLCKLLTSSQGLVRHHARIELRKNGAKGIAAVDRWIAKMDRNNPDFEQAALEVIFVCGGLNQARPALIDTLLNSKSIHFRGAAVNQIRLQAEHLDHVSERLTKTAKDEHPRVLIQVINAISHLQQTDPKLTKILSLIKSDNKHVINTIKALDYGTQPVKGRSVPVLEVDLRSQLTHWFRYGPKGKGQAVLHTSKKSSGGGANLYRTFITSDKPQSAIIGINNKALEIYVNGSLKFSQNSFWSGDQQVQIDLEPGTNVIEVELLKSRRQGKGLPPVFLYDAVGSALSGAKYVTNTKDLERLAAVHDQFLKERGTVLRVTAAPGLQFAPKLLQAEPGSKVRLIFDNPDNMEHNFLLIAPGSVAEIGSLADKMAAETGAGEKEYIPDSDKILVHSKLLGPGSQQELVFTAPEKPGKYPYLCTFPGHWRIMQGVLTVAKDVPQTSKKKGESVSLEVGDGVLFETSPTSHGFKKLLPPPKPHGKITANQKTNNDSLATLTDGKLGTGFGPIFGNGIKNGAYKMDLGKSQPVTAITSWSHQTSGKRGAQTVTIFGSNSPTDPGWNLADKSRFTPLGTLSTGGQKLQNFTALSRHAPEGKSLGTFRWIIWQASPITKASENTAFQELSVEFGTKSRLTK